MNNDVTDTCFATWETYITSLMVNGPKQSIPQYVNGGADSTLSSGRFTSDVLALGSHKSRSNTCHCDTATISLVPTTKRTPGIG